MRYRQVHPRGERGGRADAHEDALPVGLLDELPLLRRQASPTGSFRAYIFWTLSEARSRLAGWLVYRSQILQVNTRRIALDEIYIFSFVAFQIMRFRLFFKTFAAFLQNSTQFILIFKEDGRFCIFFVKCSPILGKLTESEFH